MPKRKKSHFQKKEAPLEKLTRKMRLREVVKHIPTKSVVVDLGCGFEGKLLKIISKDIKKGTGLDIKVDTKELPLNVDLVTHDIEKPLKFKGESVDVVCSTAVIEHLEKPSAMLSEAHRILKKGGVLLMTTPSDKYSSLLEFMAKIGFISKEEIADHKRYYNQKSLRSAVGKAGFNKKNINIRKVQFPGFNLLVKATK